MALKKLFKILCLCLQLSLFSAVSAVSAVFCSYLLTFIVLQPPLPLSPLQDIMANALLAAGASPAMVRACRRWRERLLCGRTAHGPRARPAGPRFVALPWAAIRLGHIPLTGPCCVCRSPLSGALDRRGGGFRGHCLGAADQRGHAVGRLGGCKKKCWGAGVAGSACVS